jgi:hypothetical protein
MNSGTDMVKLAVEALEKDKRYQQVLSGVEDEQTRKKIDDIVKKFIVDMSKGFSAFAEPDIKQKLLEMIKRG